MDGLHVQRLFAVPALRVLLVLAARLGMVEGARSHDLAELVALQGGQAAVDGPLVYVLDDGGRRVGVDDGDRLAGAVLTRDSVGALHLLRRFSARGVRESARSVRVGEPGRLLLAPVGRARPAGDECGRRRGAGVFGDVVVDERRGLIETDDAADDAGDRVRDGEKGGGRAERLAPVAVVAKAGAKRRRGLGHGALRLNVVVVRRGVGDAEALAVEPALDRAHAALRRGELLAELLRRQVLAVLSAARRRNRFCERLHRGVVLPPEIDAKADVIRRADGGLEVFRGRPGRHRTGQCRSSGRRRGDGDRRCDEDRGCGSH